MTTPSFTAYLNPDDLATIGAHRGSIIRIRSSYGEVDAIADTDPNLRRGIVSMSHAWGDHPDRDPGAAVPGSSTAVLIDNTEVYDRFTGQPRMSNIPVSVMLATAPAMERVAVSDGT